MAQVDWQHGISYTDAGTLLLSTEGRNGNNDRVTMVREYTVDHKQELLTEIWNRNSEEHATTNGDAWRLSNGNTLHVIGSSGHIKEYAADGEIVWHLDITNENGTGRLLGRGEFIEDLYTLVNP